MHNLHKLYPKSQCISRTNSFRLTLKKTMDVLINLKLSLSCTALIIHIYFNWNILLICMS